MSTKKKTTKQQRPKARPKVARTKQRRPRAQERPRPAGRLRERLSTSALMYAAALRDTKNADLTCVPSQYPPIPSTKYKMWTKGAASVGSAGWGAIVVDPGYGVCSDLQCVSVSSTAWAGSGQLPATMTAAGMVPTVNNGPFVSGQLSSQSLQARLVGCNLTVWPICAELDLQGELYAITHPDNESLLNMTVAQINGYPTSLRFPVDSSRRSITLSWSPTKPEDVDFNIMGHHQPSMAIIFTGKAATSNWLAYEVYWIYEYIGSTAAAGKSISYADPAGFSAVLTTLDTQGGIYESGRAAVKSLVNAAGQYLYEMSGPVLTGAQGAVGASMAAYGMRAMERYGGPRIPPPGADVRPVAATTIETPTLGQLYRVAIRNAAGDARYFFTRDLKSVKAHEVDHGLVGGYTFWSATPVDDQHNEMPGPPQMGG